MIRYTAFLLVAFLLETLTSEAQPKSSYTGTININPVRVLQAGKTLYVKVKSAGAVDIIPRLVSSSDTLELPKVSLKGRNEYLTYERVLSLMSLSERSVYSPSYQVVRNLKVENQTIEYRYTLPFEAWMAEAYLDVQKDECGLDGSGDNRYREAGYYSVSLPDSSLLGLRAACARTG